MTNEIKSIAIDRFVPHPDNPNRMSKANFAKLVRNIERTGRYEPLIVRPYPPRCTSGGVVDCFQIINGHHRCKALAQLGYKTADAIVWDIDDEQTDILLATLNRLGGSDVLDKKLALLRRLNERWNTRELAKLLPQTKKQIERLTSMLDTRQCKSVYKVSDSQCLANPMVFFVNDKQQQIIEKALSIARQTKKEKAKAAKNAAALTVIAQSYIARDRRRAGPDVHWD